ncbi:MAG: hypothetical protein JXA94_07595 [Parachlamydiales bacterium]|nr:hypothetical protein [Parachlamydiales bacterium]
MKKYLIIFLLFFTFAFGEENLEDPCVFVKKMNKEKFLIKFPSSFDIEKNEDFLNVIGRHEESLYQFCVFSKDEKFLNDSLIHLKNSPYIKDLKIDKKNENDLTIYLIEYNDPKISGDNKNMNVKSKIILTDNNIYCFFVAQTKELENKLDSFVSSFHIEQKNIF